MERDAPVATKDQESPSKDQANEPAEEQTKAESAQENKADADQGAKADSKADTDQGSKRDNRSDSGDSQGDQQGGGQNRGRNDNNAGDDDGEGRGGRRGRRFRDRRRRERGGEGGGGGGGGERETELRDDDVVQPVAGILDVLDNYAFVRTSGYLPGSNDVYVSMNMVRKNGLRRGDAITGAVRVPRGTASSPTRGRSSTRWCGWTPSTADGSRMRGTALTSPS